MRQCIHLVDDEAPVRDALGWLFRSRDLPYVAYDGAEAFVAAMEKGNVRFDSPACLVLDVRMPGMTGIELFDRLTHAKLTQAMPVIFLTGHGELSMAVEAIKRGAFDFVEKPANDNRLVDRAIEALAASRAYFDRVNAQRAAGELLEALTTREREVMELVMDGLSNKAVASKLDIAVRTVEVHRARIFEKLNVKNAVELVQRLRGQGAT